MGSLIRSGQARISLFLVEPNPFAARFLLRFLKAGPNLQVEAHRDVSDLPPALKNTNSVFVLDGDALAASLGRSLRLLSVGFPQAKSIVLGEQCSKEELLHLLSLGVHGFVSYSEAEGKLPRAVRRVCEGHLWIPLEVLEEYVRRSAPHPASKGSADEILTERERQVCELIEHCSNKQISSALGISESTVKFRLSNIFRKLGVRDRQTVLGVFRLSLAGPR